MSLHRQHFLALLGRSPSNTSHTVVFWCCFDPCSDSKLSGRSPKSSQRFPALLKDGRHKWRTVCLHAAVQTVLEWLGRTPEATLHNMFPPVHRIRSTFEGISPVWLSRLIIGCAWRPGPERGSPRCEAIRLGQPGSFWVLQEAGRAPG